ncbi:toll-like receptor 4 isoform X2 [Mercenaria mercenaria]|uniref:toll-like receptor 4 isoform X2 n=1 Tax=Mercenaria mercenaria TaxID=6596 RepID=UPI00234F94E0|nr:toll-like receptor 4 isoform X2 [Mercenaria mercenaria]
MSLDCVMKIFKQLSFLTSYFQQEHGVCTKTFITLSNWIIIMALNEHCDRVDTTTLKCNYIPKDVPHGISSVRIVDFIKQHKSFEVNSSHFETGNWERIKSLQLTSSESELHISITFKSKCFHGLKILHDLQIHIKIKIRIDPDVFIGLDTLKLLDMSQCVRLYLKDLIPSLKDLSLFWVVNSTLNISGPIKLSTQEVTFRQNNVKYLDVDVQCNIHAAPTIKRFDLAQNGLEFLHPSIPACFPNLEKVDLSSNQLYKMFQEHYLLFEQLPNSLRRLRMINLSTNFLTSIPEDIFIQNHDLEIIDLSHNELDQVTFTLRNLEKLAVLDLQYNRIKILNGMSINNLNMAPMNTMVSKLKDIKATIHLEYNPISCSKCEAKKFINWLTSTKSVNIPTANLRCITEDGSTQPINHHALELVQGICNKETIIISTCASVGLSALIAMVTATIIYKYRKWARYIAKRKTLLNKLQEGQGQYEFVTFLSYDSDDINFVQDYLLDILNENLQLMTGLDRNLVCTVDMYGRPGYMKLNETALCIERASAVIMVVSDSFCSSMDCHHEVDQAYRLNKPIILMMKGHVDENLMMPTMKMLFNSNVRILWTLENDEYILKTTWENVCTSVLDLIVQNECG